MANYRQELAQDAACQNHTGHMTGLWFLPSQNTNELMNIHTHTHTHTHRVIQKDGLNFVILYFKIRKSDI